MNDKAKQIEEDIKWTEEYAETYRKSYREHLDLEDAIIDQMLVRPDSCSIKSTKDKNSVYRFLNSRVNLYQTMTE
jgi:hypothetical protein